MNKIEKIRSNLEQHDKFIPLVRQVQQELLEFELVNTKDITKEIKIETREL